MIQVFAVKRQTFVLLSLICAVSNLVKTSPRFSRCSLLFCLLPVYHLDKHKMLVAKPRSNVFKVP